MALDLIDVREPGDNSLPPFEGGPGIVDGSTGGWRLINYKHPSNTQDYLQILESLDDRRRYIRKVKERRASEWVTLSLSTPLLWIWE